LDRRRLEWLTAGIALQAYASQFVLLPTLLTFGNGYNTAGLIITDGANVLGAICLLYGFLRYRVLDIVIVINRAAVFAVLSSAMVVVFMSLEHLLNKYIEAQSHVTSAVITLVIALAIGLALRVVHQHVDRFASSVVFRARHRANELLRSFGRETAFITDETVLRERMLQALIECGGAENAALYETNDDGDYELTFERHSEGPPLIRGNDPAAALLKDKCAPIFVDSHALTLSGELLFPMFVRGELSGIVLCGKRRERETYAPDDIEAMAYAIEHAAVQMDALRTERLRNQLSEVQDLVRAYMKLEADGSRVLERIAEISGVQEDSRTPHGVKHA
jgi:GAF domain-containing protein